MLVLTIGNTRYDLYVFRKAMQNDISDANIDKREINLLSRLMDL